MNRSDGYLYAIIVCVCANARRGSIAHNLVRCCFGVSGNNSEHTHTHSSTPETCTACNTYTFYFNYQLVGLETIRFGFRRYKRNDFITYNPAMSDETERSSSALVQLVAWPVVRWPDGLSALRARFTC